jgi:hypothetical protein
MRHGVALIPLVLLTDPIWSAKVTLRDPNNQPVEKASVGLDCSKSKPYGGLKKAPAISDAKGYASIGGTGTQFPVDCDVVVTKAGYQPFTIAYRELCPNGPQGCNRVFERAITLQQEAQPEAKPPEPEVQP